MKFLRLLLLAAALVSLNSCAGYHLGAIKPTIMADVKTIAIPAFKNETLLPHIEVLVANAVIRQFQLDGTYQITSEDKADVILEGSISDITRHSSRSVRGNVFATAEFTEVLTFDYKLTKRSSGAQVDRGLVIGQTSFFVTGDIQQNERQAIPLAAEDAAKRLVVRLSEGW